NLHRTWILGHLSGGLQEHLIHPGTLDILLQPLLATLGEGIARGKKTMVPLSLTSLEVAAEFPNEVGAQLSGFHVVNEHAGEATRVDAWYFHHTLSGPKIQVRGMQHTELPKVWTGDADSIEKQFRSEDGIVQQLTRSRSRNEYGDLIKRALFHKLSQEREASADQIDVPLEPRLFPHYEDP
ncbi:hypothetical protein LTR96_011881, partial [Exophiala xenobiotica]